MKAPTRWNVRVTFTDGREAFLRHGAQIGKGPIVQFRTKRDAEINAEMVAIGMDDGTLVAVVRAPKPPVERITGAQGQKGAHE